MKDLTTILFVVVAVLLGVLVASFGTLVWGVLYTINLKVAAGVPWSAVAMAIVLIGYWLYLSGAGWPRSTASVRAERLRARRIDAATWRDALIAGAASAAALAGLWILLSRASGFAPNALPDVSGFSPAFYVPLLVMGSLVAPICEEAGYRGYMQGALEQRLPAVAAIAISSIVFALAHLTHGLIWEKLLVYLLGGVVWGTTAYLARSILPGLVSHAATDVFFFTLVWPGDGHRAPLAFDRGAVVCVAMVVLGAIIAVVAFRRLRRPPAESS